MELECKDAREQNEYCDCYPFSHESPPMKLNQDLQRPARPPFVWCPPCFPAGYATTIRKKNLTNPRLCCVITELAFLPFARPSNTGAGLGGGTIGRASSLERPPCAAMRLHWITPVRSRKGGRDAAQEVCRRLQPRPLPWPGPRRQASHQQRGSRPGADPLLMPP